MRKIFFLLTVLSVCITGSLLAQEAKYELKSAIVQKETTAMGQSMPVTWYMDDYGKKESILTSIEMPEAMGGGTKNLMVISKEDEVTTVDLNEKVAYNTPLPEKPINFLTLNPEIMQQHNLKEVGEETVLGKPCKIYTMQRTEMGMTVDMKIWIWKGIQLKVEASAGGMNVYTEQATKIEENVSVPAEKFSIPAGIEVQ